MITSLSPDGYWREAESHLANAPIHAYNVRSAWALARYGNRLGHSDAVDVAVMNGHWVCTMQRPDGWFDHMSFNIAEPPITHTIAYTVQGLMELGAIVGNEEFIRRSERAARAIFASQNAEDGSLPGQYMEGWRPVGEFTSITGNAQMAIIGHRLAKLTGNEI